MSFTEVEDFPENVDMSELKDFKLPPAPRGVRKWNERDVRFNGEWFEFEKRIAHKLYALWITWASVIMSANINTQLKEECEPDSPLFEARTTIIDIMDQIGKNLADTDILEEIAWLSTDDRDSFLAAARAKRTLSGTMNTQSPPQEDPSTEDPQCQTTGSP